jgi:hypothetical protein
MDTRENLRTRLDQLASHMDDVARSCGDVGEHYLAWCEAWPALAADVEERDREWFDHALLETVRQVFSSDILRSRIASGAIPALPHLRFVETRVREGYRGFEIEAWLYRPAGDEICVETSITPTTWAGRPLGDGLSRLPLAAGFKTADEAAAFGITQGKAAIDRAIGLPSP